MNKIFVLFLTTALTWGLSGCGTDTGAESDTVEVVVSEEATGAGITAEGIINPAGVDYEEDALDLMGMDYQSFLEKYDKSMIINYYDQESMEGLDADYYYVLNNGVEVNISGGVVISVRTFYNMETAYAVPVLNGIGGEDSYDDAVAELGKPYFEGPELAGRGEDKKEFYTAVFYAGKYRYLKVYFDNETKYVSYIACFYSEPPVLEETGGIKTGDSLDDLKAAYADLYYATAYYDESQGEPRYNRIYYTPVEARDRGAECLEFYLSDKKIVRITYNLYDIPGWRGYEDIFGMDNVYKENNMIGDQGNIIYFYDDVSGNEQVLLKVENCATEEIDVDGDEITEIIAYRAGSVEIIDYDIVAKAVMRLDICEALGAVWSSYLGNAANIKEEYAMCIAAGFKTDGTMREEVYSIKDNILTYIGPYSQDMFQ